MKHAVSLRTFGARFAPLDADSTGFSLILSIDLAGEESLEASKHAARADPALNEPI